MFVLFVLLKLLKVSN